jgi:hypothetical protein
MVWSRSAYYRYTWLIDTKMELCLYNQTTVELAGMSGEFCWWPMYASQLPSRPNHIHQLAYNVDPFSSGHDGSDKKKSHAKKKAYCVVVVQNAVCCSLQIVYYKRKRLLSECDQIKKTYLFFLIVHSR